ncbi:MAG TPA: pirin family protein [Candidatus Paceibacterota bacterium]
MKTLLHRSTTRGGGDYGWLSTRYSFSFANWYDPTRMGFGKLRVLNDDQIAPSTGFGAHSHRDMEIITIVTGGTVTHTDSLGNSFDVPAGDVQVMSAGTGVTHAEENKSEEEPLTLFQIWIETNKPNSEPNYAQKAFNLGEQAPGIALLASEGGREGSLPIQQDAYISYARIDAAHPLSYALRTEEHGVYVFVVGGSVTVGDIEFGARDGLGVSEFESITLSATDSASVILIEVPMR